MLNKLFFFFILATSLYLPLVSRAQTKAELYFFYSQTCPHCAKEEIFLDKLSVKYQDSLVIKRYEVSQNQANVNFFIDFAKSLGAEASGVPFTAIGSEYFVGFLSEETTGVAIEGALQEALGIQAEETKKSDNITVPILGSLDPKSFSLPVLTIVFGFLDGFNPCAMWTLVFLITLLLGMKNRRRMWILGTVFIVSSALVYFLFMTAWLKVMLFFGFIFWVRIFIGLVAMMAGGYNLREYFKNKEMVCKVTNQEKRRKVFDNLKKIVTREKFMLALLGIMALAFTVNLVELVCSAGFPAVYTQILALNNLAPWQYYSYISLYIFFFMLDDLLVFIIAMVTLKITGFSTKYSRLSNLIGGLLIFLLGLLLIFKPQWLMLS
jgi:glutaredoxin